MKSIFGYILTFIAGATLVASCSVVNNALKSGDAEFAYDQALILYENEKWDKAASLFDARSPFIEDAEGMYALCHYYMAPPPERDQAVTSQAIIAITEFMSRYPESDKIDEFESMLTELSERLMEKSYMNAYTYYKIGRYKSAIVAFKNAMKQHPNSPYTEEMMYYTTVSAYRLAENSVESKQLDRYLAMLDSYYSFLAEYPESKQIKELERMAKNARNFIDKHRTTDTE